MSAQHPSAPQRDHADRSASHHRGPARARTRPALGWLLGGLGSWLLLAAIWFADVSLQEARLDSPRAWSGVLLANAVGSLLPAVALGPLVLAVLSRARRRRPPRRRVALLHVGLGLAFWLLWSVSLGLLAWIGFLSYPPPDLGLTERIASALAGLGFNALVLYAVVATVHEAVHRLRDTRALQVRTSRLRTELSRAQAAALGARLHPHFLFNTLHVASGLMSRNVAAAQEVLVHLRELLHGTLRSDERQVVSLAEELELVERYLGIQRARFGDRLEVSLTVAPETSELLVPPLLLQPLVENAVRHGTSRRSGRGRIEIVAEPTADGGGRLVVGDSGPGFGGPGALPLHEGVGLAGTRARLRLLFGDRASLTYGRSSLGGARVELRVPPDPDPAAAEPAQ